MPVLREMVELLFSKGYIKLLFATETFAVGINMPTKTVIFTDINKFDGNSLRMLYPHEYTQMAGRAGRRGIDTVGSVIHLNNLFRNVETLGYKQMVKGNPQKLVSKFKISYNLLLNLISIGDQNFAQFAKQSMMQNTIDKELHGVSNKLTTIKVEIDNFENSIRFLQTPINIVNEYIDLLNKRTVTVNSKRKEIDRKIKNLVESYKFIENDKATVIKLNEKYKEQQQLQYDLSNIERYVDNNVISVLNLLEDCNYIFKNADNIFELTLKGSIGVQLREVHCILFTELIINNKLDDLNVSDIVSFLSCFTNISIPEELKTIVPYSPNKKVENLIIEIIENNQKLEEKEDYQKVESDTRFEIHFDLIQYIYEWCECEDINDCKLLLQKMSTEKEIFLGEFVKCILKMNNIVSELEKVAEKMVT